MGCIKWALGEGVIFPCIHPYWSHMVWLHVTVSQPAHHQSLDCPLCSNRLCGLPGRHYATLSLWDWQKHPHNPGLCQGLVLGLYFLDFYMTVLGLFKAHEDLRGLVNDGCWLGYTLLKDLAAIFLSWVYVVPKGITVIVTKTKETRFGVAAG